MSYVFNSKQARNAALLAANQLEFKTVGKRELEQARVDLAEADRQVVIALSELEKANSRVDSEITSKYITVTDISLSVHTPGDGYDVINVGKDGLLKLARIINERLGE